MTDFKPFAQVVHGAIKLMTEGELFEVDISGDDLWAAYLAAFPEGTDPIYRKRTQHDCACCRGFIKHYGKVVSLKDGKITTIWPHTGLEYPYDWVAAKMDEVVRSKPIANVFRTKELSFGAIMSREYTECPTDPEVESVKTWHHFHGPVGQKQRSQMPDTDKGQYKGSVDVFRRGLEELKVSALEDVLDLIANKSVYRGDEFEASVRGFQTLRNAYATLTSREQQDIFVWQNAGNKHARFRNTAIGTLVQDLSEGKSVADSVNSFGTKLDPTNYKRPTSIITPSMVRDAMDTITTLGFEPALHRRFAKMSDITVNNVLWADASTKDRMMRSPIENALQEAAVTRAPKDVRADTISIEEFVANVLPNTKSMEMMVKGQHMNNFVSLTAPKFDGPTPLLFKWPNNFAWSYDGNVADSIKEKVKRAGGNVTNAALRVSLAWFNYDDLDIHVIEPNGHHIYFYDKDGKLDVDMNMGHGKTRQPVENVSWKPDRLRDGLYKVYVHQYQQRETIDFGFQIEIENAGKLYQLSYAPVAKGEVPVCTIKVERGVIAEIQTMKNIVGGGFSQEKWNIKTETMVPVETVMLSPNHWDGHAIGNKHWIFALQGCLNPDPTRGIYNEFLQSELDKHRKVFEVLGDKTKCPASAEQISGLGFSSTRGDTVAVRVSGYGMLRTFNINF